MKMDYIERNNIVLDVLLESSPNQATPIPFPRICLKVSKFGAFKTKASPKSIKVISKDPTRKTVSKNK